MKILKIIGLLLTAVVLTVACSKSDDDDDNGGKGGNGGNGGGNGQLDRVWNVISESGMDFHIDFDGKDSRPDWQNPSPYDYESWMIMQVTLPLELRDQTSPNDLLAVFLNQESEPRVVASPAVNQWSDEEDYTFILKILGNNESKIRESFVFKYYSEKAHRIFVYNDINHFIPEEILGIEHEYCLTGLLGELQDIYPVISYLSLDFPDDLEPNMEDESPEYVVAFVGDQCRGIVRTDIKDINLVLKVFGKEEGEVATLYYLRDGVYTALKPTFTIEDTNNTLVVE